VGTQLAGAAIGVKGTVPSRFGRYSYGVFAGTPVYAPPGFPAPSVTLGFQVAAQF
jgi:hemolysin activation/secretion protein